MADTMSRQKAAAQLFNIFVNSEGEVREAAMKALHELEYHVETEYVLEDKS